MASHERNAIRDGRYEEREKGGELIGMAGRDASALNQWDAILNTGRQIGYSTGLQVKI